VTPYPKAASDQGYHRFAIVLDSYRKDEVDLFFDADFFLLLLKALSRYLRHNDLRILTEAPGKTMLLSFAELDKYYQQAPKLEREPPRQIFWYQDRELVCHGLSELWARTGGPEPYSDSYTFSLYTKADWTHRFRSICEEVCQATQIQRIDFIQGMPGPR